MTSRTFGLSLHNIMLYSSKLLLYRHKIHDFLPTTAVRHLWTIPLAKKNTCDVTLKQLRRHLWTTPLAEKIHVASQ